MDDLESDFSAIHGIQDMYQDLDGPRFFRMAFRMAAYQGVMRARIEAEQEKQRPKSKEELEHLRKTGGLSQEEQRAMDYAAQLKRHSDKR